MKTIKPILVIVVIASCQTEASTHSAKLVEKIEEKDSVYVLQAEEPKIEKLEDSVLLKAPVAVDFINSYVEYVNKEEDWNPVDWVNSNPNVSQDFKEAHQKMIKEAYEEDPEYGLGYDPVVNAQDYPDNGFQLVSLDSLQGDVVVSGVEMEYFIVKMKLKVEGGKCVVDGSGSVNMPDNNVSK